MKRIYKLVKTFIIKKIIILSKQFSEQYNLLHVQFLIIPIYIRNYNNIKLMNSLG